MRTGRSVFGDVVPLLKFRYCISNCAIVLLFIAFVAKKRRKILLSNVAEVRVNLKPAFTQWIKELLKTSWSLGQWQWGRACGN